MQQIIRDPSQVVERPKALSPVPEVQMLGRKGLDVTAFSELGNPRHSVSNVLRQLNVPESSEAFDAELNHKISDDNFKRIFDISVVGVKDCMRAAYHDFPHAMAVAERFSRYLAATGASNTVQKLGLLAGVFHDFDHPGFRYREDARNASHPELTNEEFAAASAVEFLRPFLQPAQLKWIHDVILATSFGQRKGKDPAVNTLLDARPHLIRPYEPVTLHEKLIHLADVNSTDSEMGFEDFVRGGFKLMKEISQGSVIPPSSNLEFEAHLKKESGFLNYIGALISEVQQSINEAGCQQLVTRFTKAQGRLHAVMNRFEGPDSVVVMSIAKEVLTPGR